MSISHTPQAKDDAVGAVEDHVLTIDVMANDLGGAAKHLYSVDQNDPLSVQTASVSELGAAISIADGKIVYDPTGAGAIEALGLGETATDTFNYVIQLGNGTLSVATVTVTVTGTNDAPVLSADASGPHGLSEIAGATGSATADTASASLAFHDVDLSDTHTVAIGAPAAAWTLAGGTDAPLSDLTHDDQTALKAALANALTSTLTDSTHTGAGQVALAFSAADKAFDFLAQGETLTVTYDVTVTDNHGATSTQPVTFTITGSNDGPALAADATASHAIAEAAGATGSTAADTTSATLTFTDADLTDHHTASVSAPTLAWSGGDDLPAGLATSLTGALTATVTDSTGSGAGSVATSFTASDATFDFLAQGETLKVTYDVTVDDGHGGTSTQAVTITVTGANDGPVLAADATANHAIDEAAGTTGSATSDVASATLTFTDVDLSDQHTASVSAPTIAWSGAAELPAGLATALDGALTTTVAHSTGNGAGSVAASFSAPDSAFDFLAQGETLTVTYGVTVDDGHGGTSTQPVTILVHGSNDVPVISATGTTAAGAITEDATPGGVETATGAIAFADPDLDDRHTVTAELISTTGAHAYGALTPVMSTDADGAGAVTWTYNADDAGLQELAAGQTVTETYAVTVDDGHGGTVSQDVVVTLTGANDAPVVASTTFALNEAADVTGSPTPDLPGGVMGFTDVDLTDQHTVSVAAAPISVSLADGGDVPAATLDALNGAFTAAVATDSTGTGQGELAVNFTAPDSAFDFLAQGEVLTVTYNLTVDDGHGGTSTQPVSFTVTGANDAPVVSGAITGAAVEDGPSATLDALANAHDVDDGAQLTVVNLPDALPAGVTYDAATHQFTLDPTNAAYQHLAVGETQTVTVAYDVSDGTVSTAASASWTVTGANDAPVLQAQPAAINLIQNGDFDQGGAFWTNTAPGGGVEAGGNGAATYGTNDPTPVLELDANGPGSHDDVSQSVASTAGEAYTFSFDVAQRVGTSAASNTFEVMWNGQVIDTITPGSTNMEHHSYTLVGSGSTGTLDFVETGTDDSLGTIIDNVSLVAAGIEEQPGATGSSAVDSYATTLAFSDVDLSDVHTVSVAAPTLTLSGGEVPAGLASALTGALSTAVTEQNGTGSVDATFSAADSTFDFLQAGQTLTVTYAVTVDDGHGGTSTQPVSFTVTGTDDAPVFIHPLADADGTMLQSFGVALGGDVSDVDSSSLTWTATTADGAALPAWLHFDAATHQFSGTPAGADVGGLDIKVTVSDGSLSTSDTFHLTVDPANLTLIGTSAADSLTGDIGNDSIVGNAGSDVLLGAAGNDLISGDAAGANGPPPTASFSLSAVATADLAHNNTIVTPAGGTTVALPAGDDNFSNAIDITSVFGSQGLNFFGNHFTNLYVNNNGNLTFGSPSASYTPTSIANGSIPIIAPFWADVDTRGSGQVTYNLDAADGVFTATWNNVGYYFDHTNPTDTFQLQLINEGSGNFDIVFRYQHIGWTTGDASNGSGGLGGYVARAGFNSGNGTEYEIPESANQTQMLGLAGETNVGIPGVFEFQVRNGVVSTANADIIDGGAGQDTLIGGAGPDTFVFHAGEANGDVVVDFNPGDGDKLQLIGYGDGATFTERDSTHWVVNYGAGQHDVITFENGPPIQLHDYTFMSSSVF